MHKLMSVLLIVSISLLSAGCATWNGIKQDTSDGWEKTKETTSEVWHSTKQTIHEATAD